MSATKVSKHTAYGYSTSTICALDNGKISMINIEVKIALKKVCTNIWEHAIRGAEFRDNNNNSLRSKSKVKDYCHYICKYRGAAHSIFNLKTKIPKYFPVVFHNDSKFDYHFITRLLAETFEGQFE